MKWTGLSAAVKKQLVIIKSASGNTCLDIFSETTDNFVDFPT